MSARARAIVALALAAASCGAPDDGGARGYVRDRVGVASLSVPKSWQSQLATTETERQVWSPAGGANDAKETLAIRIAARRPRMSDEAILAAASAAQGALPRVKVVATRSLTTRQGWKALWLETSFQPSGSDQTYRRAHVTAIGREHVFHLFYTAVTPDPDWQVLDQAVDSLTEEG